MSIMLKVFIKVLHRMYRNSFIHSNDFKIFGLHIGQLVPLLLKQ